MAPAAGPEVSTAGYAGEKKPFLRVLSRFYWPLALLLGVFGATAFVVPLLAPIAIHDDWVYARAVEILLREGRLTVLDVSSAINPFQSLWAGMFGLVFGDHLGVFRLSTFALVLISGPAFYGIGRELGLSRRLAVLATAIYLFNPIMFSLAYTFMTDAHFVALLVIACYFYLRGIQRGSGPSIVAGSAIAACAFLVRQQGIFIPAAVMTCLLLARRLSFNAKSARVSVQVAGVPFVVAILYLFWLTRIQGVPGAMETFARALKEATLGERVELGWNLIFVVLMYAGWYILPVALSLLPRVRLLTSSLSARGSVFVGIGLLVMVAGAIEFSRMGRAMPYVPSGDKYAIGPSSLVGLRPQIADDRSLKIFTFIVAVGAVILLLGTFARPAGEAPKERDLGAGVLLSVVGWQALGLFITSHWFRNDLITLDRYVLVLLPLILCLFLRRIGNLVSIGAAWAMVALVGLGSVIATRDYIVFQQAVWTLADRAINMGVPLEKMDAGASWDGYFVSDGLAVEGPSPTLDPQWWVKTFAPKIDSTFLVSASPIDGYTPFYRLRFSQWLDSEEAYLYLSKRGQPPICPPICPP